ncbi:nitrogen fixation protein NifZ [Paraburkholderia sp. CNPSo 3157]|uniref:Nitrogen fixation protein NifZ n=1 Tax=Paraburkholderia franconis TaxID=2654983 RepID=A0A7X1NL94_9BURK|nr:nitrogen fixation protein NifZ [Paraburkholderia franconis]MPW23766.1 nitrogen fixation protein NifZ [Paraburkholderia franconis]
MHDFHNDDAIEVAFAPSFSIGERVVARSVIRNDGTYTGKNMGEILANRGDVGYVTRIDTFLQRFYIYAVHFVETDHLVGMREKELCTLDHLPEDVLARAGERAATLRQIGVATRDKVAMARR